MDEVQMLEEFEEVLNSLLHISNVAVYVTGSNSKFLSQVMAKVNLLVFWKDGETCVLLVRECANDDEMIKSIVSVILRCFSLSEGLMPSLIFMWSGKSAPIVLN